MRDLPRQRRPVRRARCACPRPLPATGYLWVGSARREFEVATRRAAGGAAALDRRAARRPARVGPAEQPAALALRLHLLVRPAGVPAPGGRRGHARRCSSTTAAARWPRPSSALEAIDTSPVGFAVFDRVLLTVHPTDCRCASTSRSACTQQTQADEARSGARLPTQPGRPDAAHGQPHGRQLPRAAPPADAPARLPAAGAVQPAQQLRQLAAAARIAQRAAPAGRHLRGPAQRHHRMDRRARRVARRARRGGAPRARTAARALARRAGAHRARAARTCGGSSPRPKPRCRCTSRRRATAPTASCAR